MRSLVVVALTVVADACSAPVRAPNSPASTTAVTNAVQARPTVETPPINVAAIDSLITRVVAEKPLVDVSVGVMQNGKIVLTNGYGFR